MPKKKPNFRKALAQMLEYIGTHLLVVGESQFVLSDDVMLKNKLIVQTLEEGGCIELLGRLNLTTQARCNRAFPGLMRRLHDQALPKIKHPWGHWVWVVNTTRYDQLNPQLLLTRPLLEQIEKQYGKDPQIRAVGEDDSNSGNPPWRTAPV